MLDEAEDVALGLAQRIPPTAAVVVDDQDFGLAAAVFQAAAGASRAVEPPHRWQPLQQRRTTHAGLQLLDFRVLPTHGFLLPLGLSGGKEASLMFSLCSMPLGRTSPTAKPARGKG